MTKTGDTAPPPPWASLTLDHLLEGGRVAPSKPAVVCGTQVRTYGELRDRSRRLANGLIGAGIQPGDRVAVLTCNRAEFFEIEIAIAAAGGIFVPLSWRLKAAEIAAFLRQSQVRVAFVEAQYLDTVQGLRWSGALPDLRTVVTIGSESGDLGYDELCASSSATLPTVGARLDDPHAILHTSGTTSDPKGVVWTGATLLWNAHQQVADFRLTAEHSNYVIGDLDRVGGSHDFTWALLLLGGTVHVKRSGGFDPRAALDYLDQQAITHVLCVPTVLYDIVGAATASDRAPRALEMVMCGGAAVPRTIVEPARALFAPAEVVYVYGLTEGGASVTFTAENDARTHPGTSGRPSTNVELRIVDDFGRTIPTGETGEIALRAPTLMAGYWGAAGEPEVRVTDGWLRTGDVGSVDGDGYLFVSGRLHDMILSGGTRVFPSEVENVLRTHSAVGDVVVLGVPDERWGETVCAVVEPVPGRDIESMDLIDHCRERLAGFKKPSSVVFVDALPRTATGKSRMGVLRALVEAERAIR